MSIVISKVSYTNKTRIRFLHSVKYTTTTNVISGCFVVYKVFLMHLLIWSLERPCEASKTYIVTPFTPREPQGGTNLLLVCGAAGILHMVVHLILMTLSNGCYCLLYRWGLCTYISKVNFSWQENSPYRTFLKHHMFCAWWVQTCNYVNICKWRDSFFQILLWPPSLSSVC